MYINIDNLKYITPKSLGELTELKFHNQNTIEKGDFYNYLHNYLNMYIFALGSYS